MHQGRTQDRPTSLTPTSLTLKTTRTPIKERMVSNICVMFLKWNTIKPWKWPDTAAQYKDEVHGGNAEKKKRENETHTLHDAIYVNKYHKSNRGKNVSRPNSGFLWGGGGSDQEGPPSCFANVLFLDLGGVTRLCSLSTFIIWAIFSTLYFNKNHRVNEALYQTKLRKGGGAIMYTELTIFLSFYT